MTKKASPLKLRNESYGTIKVEEAFLRALEVYFIKKKDSKSPGWAGDFFVFRIYSFLSTNSYFGGYHISNEERVKEMNWVI